jgi:hypothetical protein
VSKAAASRGLGAGNAYLLLKAPRCVSPEDWALHHVEEGGGTDRYVMKSSLLAHIVRWKSEGVNYSSD